MPSITGSPAMVTTVSGMPRNPARPNAHTIPTSTTARGSRRQRTWKNSMRITIITATAMPPRVSMPPVR